MGEIHSNVPVKQVEVSAVIIRANGKVEDVGVIARWHSNVLIRFWWKFVGYVRRVKRGYSRGSH